MECEDNGLVCCKEHVVFSVGKTVRVLTCRLKLEKIDYDFLSELTLRLEKTLFAYDARIEAVEDCVASYGSAEIYIQNSKGMVCHDSDNGFDLYLGVRAKEGEDVQTYGKGWLFKKLSELDEEKCVKEVGKRVISKLGSTSIPSEKTSIVLDRKAAKSLLSAFSGSFSAELMQKGLSRLCGKLGEKIADEKITLIDEGIIEGSYLSQGFDSEGVLAKRTVLIDKGIFTSPLHNRKLRLWTVWKAQVMPIALEQRAQSGSRR